MFPQCDVMPGMDEDNGLKSRTKWHTFPMQVAVRLPRSRRTTRVRAFSLSNPVERDKIVYHRCHDVLEDSPGFTCYPEFPPSSLQRSLIRGY